MIITRDYFNNIESPTLLLCKINGEIIGEIKCVGQEELTLSNLNELNFTTYKYFDNKENDIYDLLTEMKQVMIPNKYRFVITSVDEDDDGINPKKTINAKSIEINLGQKYLEEFYINTGEDYSIDNVCLYNQSDLNHSLLYLVLHEKCPDWSINYVDPEIALNQRFFEVDRTDIYSFLTEDMEKAYDAVVIFDSFNMTISVYKEENYGKDTNIYVSYKKLIQDLSMSYSVDDIKTCLTVLGADDLNIREVNMGLDRIYNFDYYVTDEYMSEGLITAYNAWKALMDSNRIQYNNLVNQSVELYKQINYITNEKMPSYGTNLVPIDLQSQTIGNLNITVNDGKIILDGTTSGKSFILSDHINDYLENGTSYTLAAGLDNTMPDRLGLNITALYDGMEVYTGFEINTRTTIITKSYNSNWNLLELFIPQGTYNNVIIEPCIFIPGSVNKDWSKYGLVPLQEQLAAYEGQQSVMIKAGQADPSSADYQTMYLPCYNDIQAIKAQITVVQGQIETLNNQLDSVQSSMNQIATNCSMRNNFTNDQMVELLKFVREDTINSDNYVITDSMTDAERINMLKDMLDYGENELAKISQPQIQFSANLTNLFNLPEFDSVSTDFEWGNYINIIIRDNYYVKARLLSITIDFLDMKNISVTFGNLNRLKGKNIFTDITKAINTATSVSTTVSMNGSNWNAANKDVNEINDVLQSGLLSAGQSIKSSSSDVQITDNGILVSSLDSNYPDDRILIGGSRIVLSDDNLKTVREAIGRFSYTTRDGVSHDVFGVLAEAVLSGYINGTTIDSSIINIGGTSNGRIVMYDANGVEKGRWDINGITLPPGTKISWSDVTDAPTIPSKTSELTNDSDFATTSQIPTNNNQLTNGAGYETASSIKNTVITKDYIETLNVKAGSVDAENITGTTIVGKDIQINASQNKGLKIYYSNDQSINYLKITTDGIKNNYSYSQWSSDLQERYDYFVNTTIAKDNNILQIDKQTDYYAKDPSGHMTLISSDTYMPLLIDSNGKMASVNKDNSSSAEFYNGGLNITGNMGRLVINNGQINSYDTNSTLLYQLNQTILLTESTSGALICGQNIDFVFAAKQSDGTAKIYYRINNNQAPDYLPNYKHLFFGNIYSDGNLVIDKANGVALLNSNSDNIFTIGCAGNTPTIYLPEVNGGLAIYDYTSEGARWVYNFDKTNYTQTFYGNVNCNNDFTVSGTKSRAVQTEHYDTVKMNALETPEAHFADFGSGKITDNNEITIFFDPVFSETIDVNSEYQVFITKTSNKAFDYVEKKLGCFIVHGENGLSFDWFVNCKQRDYTSLRMENYVIDVPTDDVPANSNAINDITNNIDGGIKNE